MFGALALVVSFMIGSTGYAVDEGWLIYAAL
jgi:hypothetical protein